MLPVAQQEAALRQLRLVGGWRRHEPTITPHSTDVSGAAVTPGKGVEVNGSWYLFKTDLKIPVRAADLKQLPGAIQSFPAGSQRYCRIICNRLHGVSGYERSEAQMFLKCTGGNSSAPRQDLKDWIGFRSGQDLAHSGRPTCKITAAKLCHFHEARKSLLNSHASLLGREKA